MKIFIKKDSETIDTPIIKRDNFKNCHQQGAQLSYSNHGVDFIFVENKNDHQIGNAYFEIHMKEWKWVQ